ncbi:F-box protein At4g22280-like [Corylus avellana]|uniref:F-box protein At4g22280-like n=1 Tax=Corylus avellana TaxID=13451 RepID=UPI00286AC083|nr:F-box protein At4g22280-like [Corylus avellana]
METTSLIQKPQKQQKLNEEHDVDGNSKCLSNLPEEVLLDILSLLPTKDAIRTSVLSKRWDYLWASIPNLVFEQSLPAKRTLLMNFVDRALCLRDSSDIKRFTLCCDVLCDASRVNTWISAVVRHNVQELCIELDNFEGVFSLPYCLFTCKTLTSLHLEMPYMLKLPTTICFSNLKILTICKVTFLDEYLTQQLFSGLPVLEKFTLFGCSWGGLKSVSISAPKLHSLCIIETEMLDDDFWSYSDVCQVMIAGDSLKEFYYMGLLCSDYCLYKSFSLENVVIDINEDYISDHDYIPKEITHGMYKLLIGLSNVKSLRLSSDVVEVLINAEELLPHIPIFNNLIDLVFHGCSIDLDSATLLKILQNSPCLERLQFLGGFNLPFNYEEEDTILDTVPPCFLSHLKWIGVNSFRVNKKFLSALRIFLNKAIVLENIVIFFLGNDLEGNLERQDEACEQLMELPTGPQNCKIVLKWYEWPKTCEIVLQ